MALEMKGMIRYCHPRTPMIGLFRMSCCPIINKKSQKNALAERDMCCLPTMLHKMVSTFKGYRARRRLWIQAIRTILYNGCKYLTHDIMEYLSYKKQDFSLLPPVIYTPFLRHELKTIRQRFVQMSGRLVSLGYSALVLPPIEDFDYENYLNLCHPKYHSMISALYKELVRKNVRDRWRIMLSYLRKYNDPYYFESYEIPTCDAWYTWAAYCKRKNAYIYQEQCFKLNGLSATEIVLIDSWFNFMKYPMY